MERLPSKKGRKFWGESWWDGLHSAAAFYTPDHAEDYLLLLQGYKGCIPCGQCRIHFGQNLIKFPIEPYLIGNKELLFWTYIIHDSVNQSHNAHRQEEPLKISPSFPQIAEKYIISPPEKWDEAWCFILHSAAVVYIPDHANDYVKLVKSCIGLLPSKTSRVRFSQALEKCPVESYLRNNHDLFFWSYVICGMFLKSTKSPYQDVKRYYYSGLGEECKTCDK